MKLFSAFKPPAWEQRDPERRAIAVRDTSAPELLARLCDIAASDPEPVVRRAALARVSVASFLLERHRVDPDPDTRAAALARLHKLLVDGRAGLAPGARRAALALALPAELFERVAEAAPEPELRRAALARVTRAGFLQRRCVDEPDAGLRAELLERIEGEEALERVAEQLRKRDKTLARRARERVEALRLGRGDPAAIHRHAEALCQTLTRWAQQLPVELEHQLPQAQAEWQARGAAADAVLQDRVQAHFERVHAALARRSARHDEAERTRLAQAERAEADAARREVEAATPPRIETDWDAFDALLAEANRVTVAKQLGEARPALQRLRAVVPQLPALARERRERLAEIEVRVAELERWERWSGNRARARLCEELEALIAAAPHPDAVANRVRELQGEWAKVEAAEPGDADHGAGLARRFRALCGRALAPTRAYFQKRDELRGEKRAALDAVLAQAEPGALASLSPPALVGLRRQLVEALRTLDELDPKARTGMARELRAALARIDAALTAQREDAALTRRKLIAKLRRELTHADAATALVLARGAQQAWKALPRAAREHEAALEQELQALIEPLLARERDQRASATQASARIASESQRLLDELEALAGGDAEALLHAEGRIAALSASWRELHASSAPAQRDASRARAHGGERGRAARGRGEGRRPESRDRPSRNSDSERRFDQAVAKVRQAQQRLEASRRGASLQALVEAAALIAAVEQDRPDPATAQAQWQALALDEALRRRLAARWTQAEAAHGRGQPDPAASAARAAWLVEAELEAGLASPAKAQALRRQAQMQRLASRLQGAQARADDPAERLLQWILLPGGPDGEDQARFDRIAAVWIRGGAART